MIKVMLWNDGFKTIDIPVSDIVYFKVVNRKEYTTKGTFKTFRKHYYVQVGDTLHKTSETSFNALKEELKGKYQTEKHTQTEYKNFTEKRATDWTYRMIN